MTASIIGPCLNRLGGLAVATGAADVHGPDVDLNRPRGSRPVVLPIRNSIATRIAVVQCSVIVKRS
jgi:hypothetical protein